MGRDNLPQSRSAGSDWRHTLSVYKDRQSNIDKAADQSATQAAAIIRDWLEHHLKDHIKKALKEIYWELWGDLFRYLYRENWVRLLAGLLTLISVIALWMREHK